MFQSTILQQRKKRRHAQLEVGCNRGHASAVTVKKDFMANSSKQIIAQCVFKQKYMSQSTAKPTKSCVPTENFRLPLISLLCVAKDGNLFQADSED